MKKYKPYLFHILEEGEYLEKTSKGLTYEQFMKDEALKRRFLRSLEIIGEAVKNIPHKLKEKYQKIE